MVQGYEYRVGRGSLSSDFTKSRVFILMATPRTGRLKINSPSKDKKEFYGVCCEILKIAVLRTKLEVKDLPWKYHCG